MKCGTTWPSVVACTQALVRSLPSLGKNSEGGGGADSATVALRQVSTPDPLQYPGYEPPLVQAQLRLRQRRRAEDAIGDTQVMPPLNEEAFVSLRWPSLLSCLEGRSCPIIYVERHPLHTYVHTSTRVFFVDSSVTFDVLCHEFFIFYFCRIEDESGRNSYVVGYLQ